MLARFARRCETRAVFAPAVAAIVLLGLALRLAWVSTGDRLAPADSEMLYVARAFAATGRLADAYGDGAGLTAHAVPLMPVLAGSIYRVFGPTSATSEAVLIALSLTFVGLALWAMDRVMARLGSAAVARLSALAVFCLLPLNFALEMQNFRVWEGAVAAAGLAGALLWALRLDTRCEPPRWREAVSAAAAAGVMALISPPTAFAMYGLIGLVAWRRRRTPGVVAAALIAGILLAGISYPWAARNEAIFGEKVWSRTNFGFNFALGFHPAAVSPPDPEAVFVQRMHEIDPFVSPQALHTMQALGGEQAYSKMWSARTKAWVGAHPVEAERIAARHLFEFYFPPRWFFTVFSGKAAGVALQQALIWTISGLAGLCLLSRLLAGARAFLYVAVALILPALPYVLAQPVYRYHYTVAALLSYLAMEFLWRFAVQAVRGGGATQPGSGMWRPGEGQTGLTFASGGSQDGRTVHSGAVEHAGGAAMSARRPD